LWRFVTFNENLTKNGNLSVRGLAIVLKWNALAALECGSFCLNMFRNLIVPWQ
jgi:hypothetical protein